MRGLLGHRLAKATALCSGLLLALFLIVDVYKNRPTLLVNATILTMNVHQPTAEAVLIKGHRIAAVGDQASLEAQLPLLSRIIDLGGRSLLPGFVDAHSHFPSSGLASAFLDLTPPPVGDVGALDTLLRRVAEYASSRPAGQWIVGFNYDDASLAVQRHPSRSELDRVAPDNPVYLWHRSGHMGVANSLALSELGHEDHSEKGSSLGDSGFAPGRDETGRLTGLLQEGATPPLASLLRKLPLRDLLNVLFVARDLYLQAGVTTVQNGFSDMLSMRLLLWSQRLGILPQRVVVWPAYEKLFARMMRELSDVKTGKAEENLQNALDWQVNSDYFTLAALKLSVDGSPQGRTAWLTEPYLTAGSKASAYRGFPTVPKDAFKALVLKFQRAGVRLAIHANGDAAIDLVIDAIDEAQLQYPDEELQHIVVHAQTIREDQLPLLAAMGVSVTFFPSHTFFWGDWYQQQILGDERARRISPLALADIHGLPYSLHSDAPVTPINPLQVLWSATQRETLSGSILGPELVISRERALRAMTLDAAWQNDLDHDRGSLEVGKLADIVVLSGDVLKEADVRNLHVERVWIGGRQVFQKQGEP